MAEPRGDVLGVACGDDDANLLASGLLGATGPESAGIIEPPPGVQQAFLQEKRYRRRQERVQESVQSLQPVCTESFGGNSRHALSLQANSLTSRLSFRRTAFGGSVLVTIVGLQPLGPLQPR